MNAAIKIINVTSKLKGKSNKAIKDIDRHAIPVSWNRAENKPAVRLKDWKGNTTYHECWVQVMVKY